MKRKTRHDERDVYKYSMEVPIGNGKYRTETIILRPGENGVTEEHISLLHKMSDSEVYFNNKNLRPGRTKEEKKAISLWKTQYREKIKMERGYYPGKDEVEDAVNEAFPSNWNLSLDYIIGDDAESLDRSKAIYGSDVYMDASNYEVEHLYEVMEQMTEKQRQVIIMVKLEDRTLTEAAKLLGTSIPNVKKHLDKAMQHIKNNF